MFGVNALKCFQSYDTSSLAVFFDIPFCVVCVVKKIRVFFCPDDRRSEGQRSESLNVVFSE